MKIKKIFSKQIFEELMSLNRHNFLNTQDNLKYRWLKVYVFEYSDELIRDFTEITNRRKQITI
jgi:hypothetical protein